MAPGINHLAFGAPLQVSLECISVVQMTDDALALARLDYASAALLELWRSRNGRNSLQGFAETR